MLDPPHEFNDAYSIRSSGKNKIHLALDDTQSQHKCKRTEEIELIPETVANNGWYNHLGKIFRQSKNAVDVERGVVQSGIKGLVRRVLISSTAASCGFGIKHFRSSMQGHRRHWLSYARKIEITNDSILGAVNGCHRCTGNDGDSLCKYSPRTYYRLENLR
jgi:hypothetical protein